MTVAAQSALNVAGTDTDARDYTTGSWTPVPGRTYLAAIGVLDLGSARDLTNATAAGNGITWTFERSVGGAANEPGLAMWRGTADGSSFTGALTFSGVVTSGNTADGAIWGIAELDGVNPATDNGIVQSASGSSATDAVSATLSAFASAGNATGAWVVAYDNASTTGPAITAGSGFSIVSGLDAGQAAGGDGLRLAFEFRTTNDTSVDATAAAANDRMLIVAFEIKAAVVNTGTGTAAGDGSLSGAGHAARARSGSVTGAGVLSAAGVRVVGRTGSLSGAGVLEGAGSASSTRDGAGTLSGAGALSGAGVRVCSRTGTATGAGGLDAAGVRVCARTGTITGTGDAAGTGVRVCSRTGATAGAGTLTGAGSCTRSRSGTITGTGTVTATGVSATAADAACVHLAVTQPAVCTVALTGAATITLSQPAVCTLTVGTTNTTSTLTVTEPAGLALALSEC